MILQPQPRIDNRYFSVWLHQQLKIQTIFVYKQQEYENIARPCKTSMKKFGSLGL